MNRQRHTAKISRTGINQYSGKEQVNFIPQHEQEYDEPVISSKLPKPNNDVVKIPKPKKPQKSKYQRS